MIIKYVELLWKRCWAGGGEDGMSFRTPSGPVNGLLQQASVCCAITGQENTIHHGPATSTASSERPGRTTVILSKQQAPIDNFLLTGLGEMPQGKY